MTMHVIVGAGPAGAATAMRLAGQGWQVRIITRSGAGPFLREFPGVAYQLTEPFEVDSTAFQTTFGLVPIDQALAATVSWWRDQGRTAA